MTTSHHSAGTPAIGTEVQPGCVVCGAAGQLKFSGLRDRLFGAPGVWNVHQCGSAACRSLWLNPRPTRQDIGKAYLQYYTHDKAGKEPLVKRVVRSLAREKSVAADSRQGMLRRARAGLATRLGSLVPGMREHLDLMLRYLPPPTPQDLLLDVGCGDGEALDILRHVGWQVRGVELDPNGVVSARAKGLDVREGDLPSAAWPDAHFSAVTSSHVIEHLHDPAAFIAESRRILKPGGQLVVVTPNADAWTLARYGADWLNLDPPRHLLIFTAPAIEALVRSCGFSDVKVFTTARAVALSETASAAIRARGRYVWGEQPGIGGRIAAQWNQLQASAGVAAGRIPGDELVVLARK